MFWELLSARIPKFHSMNLSCHDQLGNYFIAHTYSFGPKCPILPSSVYLGWSLGIYIFKKLPRWFWYPARFGNHCLRECDLCRSKEEDKECTIWSVNSFFNFIFEVVSWRKIALSTVHAFIIEKMLTNLIYLKLAIVHIPWNGEKGVCKVL